MYKEQLNNFKPYTFTKKINTNYKLVPLKIKQENVGTIKYLPPIAKEWKNSVYSYYSNNNTIYYPVYDQKLDFLIKSYFNLYFDHKFLQHKFISPRNKRKSLQKIFVSKPEIKHTNSKIIITIYIYNKEKFALLNRIKKFQKFFLKFIIFLAKKDFFNKFLSLPWVIQNKNYLSNSNILWSFASSDLKDEYKKSNFFDYVRIKRALKNINILFKTIRKYKLRLSLNRYKLEEKLLYKLNRLVRNYYNKDVEFNIVNLKSIANNGDIFTEILTSKLKKEQSSPMHSMNILLNRAVIAKSRDNNNVLARTKAVNIDLNSLENKYKDLTISSILNKNKSNLDKLLYSLYYKTNIYSEKISYLKIRNIIFENIKYKNMGGVRLIVKGRLTKRYRADRAVYKFKWKGGLKNTDSAFKGLSSIVFRGHMDSNVEKSMLTSKRRIGSFAVKGWFSGK